jgi:hypothetical protein
MCDPAGVEHLYQNLYLMIHRPQRGQTLAQKSSSSDISTQSGSNIGTKSSSYDISTPTGSNIGTKISTSRITYPNEVTHLAQKSPPHESPTPTGSNIGPKILTSRLTDPNGVAHWSKNLHPRTYRPQRDQTLVQKSSSYDISTPSRSHIGTKISTSRITDPNGVKRWYKILHLTTHRPQRGRTLVQNLQLKIHRPTWITYLYCSYTHFPYLSAFNNDQ